MQTLTEKRVFGAKSGTTNVYVASEMGLVVVTVSADQIGEFSLARRGAVNAVAVGGRQLVIGTDEGVFVASHGHEAEQTISAETPTFEPVGSDPVGRVVAAGSGLHGILVGDADGGVYHVGTDSGISHIGDIGETGDVGEPDRISAIDGGLVAASDGVYRVSETGISHVGLADVRDVSGHGVPLAATTTGLFWLGNGWMTVENGSFETVGSDGHGHALAVGPNGLIRHGVDNDAGSVADGVWEADDLGVDSPAVDVAYGGGIVAAITEDGTLCIDAGDGWRHQLLGIRGVRSLAVGPGNASE